MRWSTIAAAVLALGLVSMGGAGGQEDSGGFVVHEWGLLAVTPGIDETPPPEFVQHVDRPAPLAPPPTIIRIDPENPPPTVVFKPIVYFYPGSHGPDRVRIWLRLPSLWGTICYPPGTVYERSPIPGRDAAAPDGESAGAIGWDLRLGPPAPRPDSPPPWWAACRVSGAAPVSLADGSAGDGFLFYEAPLAPLDPPRVIVVGNQIVATGGGRPVHDVIAIRRIGGVLHAGTIDRLAPGDTEVVGTLAPIEPAALRAELQRRLEAAGLFADEARAYLDVWAAALDGDPPITLYRLDPATIDAMAPLDLSPSPDRMVRVWFVAARPDVRR